MSSFLSHIAAPQLLLWWLFVLYLAVAVEAFSPSPTIIETAISNHQINHQYAQIEERQLVTTMSHTSQTQYKRSMLLLQSSLVPEGLEGMSSTTNQPPSVRRKYETFVWNNPTALFKKEPYKINYRVEGPENGPPILLVHGFGANVNHFRYQFPALSDAGYRVYAVDLLGFGASDKPGNAPYSIELFVDLLQDFVQSQIEQSGDDQQWIVAGNSIGGLCSLALARAIPESIRGVVLFNCAGGMTGFRYDDVPFMFRPALWFVQNIVLGPVFGGKFFGNFKTRENVETILTKQGVYRDTTNVDEELLEILLGPSDDTGAQQVFLKTFAGPPGPTPESILLHLDCPILALWGGADPWTPHDAGMHPGSQFDQYTKGPFDLVVLDNTGHCPHDERPQQVNEQMLRWIGKLQ